MPVRADPQRHRSGCGACLRDRISTPRSVARPISSMITEKMVTIEKPRSLDASGGTLPPLSSTTTLAILEAYRSRAASQTRRTCGLEFIRHGRPPRLFGFFGLACSCFRNECAPARTASAIFCPSGYLSYHSDQERLEGCVLIQNEQFLAGEEIINRLFRNLSKAGNLSDRDRIVTFGRKQSRCCICNTLARLNLLSNPQRLLFRMSYDRRSHIKRWLEYINIGVTKILWLPQLYLCGNESLAGELARPPATDNPHTRTHSLTLASQILCQIIGTLEWEAGCVCRAAALRPVR